MDTRMIEVAIGLALVFALVSLLVAAAQEVFSSGRGLRGRVLQQALQSFVGDDPEFAKALLDHPLLVSLSPQPQSERDQRRPSYIRADSVVMALMSHLVQTHVGAQRPDTPLQLVELLQAVQRGAATPVVPGAAALAGAAGTRPKEQFVRGLASLVIGVENDWPAFEQRIAAWYDAVGERSTGWFKRKTQAGVFVLGLVTAAVLNINPIVIASQLWADPLLREALVKAGAQASAAYAAQSASAAVPAPQRTTRSEPLPAPPAAAASAAQPATPAERVRLAWAGYETVLIRAMTELERDAAQRGVVLGLSQDFDAFDKALKSWLAAGATAGESGAAALLSAARALAAGLPAAPPLNAVRAEAQTLVREITAAAAPPRPAEPAPPSEAGAADRQPAPDCAREGDSAALQQLCAQLAELASLRQAGLPIGWSRNPVPEFFGPACAAGEACEHNGRAQTAFWVLNLLLMPLGWLVTALACTLGAPFWFDALSKLVRLRGSGGKPESGTTAAPTGMLATSASAGTAVAPVAPAASSEPMSDALNDDERALNVAEVQRVQRGLGLAEIEASGFFDGNTRRAIKAWQEQRGELPASGELSAAQLRFLLELRAQASAPAATTSPAAAPPATPGAGHGAHGAKDDDVADGCDVEIIDISDDQDLPAARGGVAAAEGA